MVNVISRIFFYHTDTQKNGRKKIHKHTCVYTHISWNRQKIPLEGNADNCGMRIGRCGGPGAQEEETFGPLGLILSYARVTFQM